MKRNTASEGASKARSSAKVFKAENKRYEHGRDIIILITCSKALEKCSSTKMQRATLEFLWDKFIVHPKANQGAKS